MSYGRVGGFEGPEWSRNSIGGTESMNLDPWDPQSLNHQPKNILGLDLGSLAYAHM